MRPWRVGGRRPPSAWHLEDAAVRRERHQRIEPRRRAPDRPLDPPRVRPSDRTGHDFRGRRRSAAPSTGPTPGSPRSPTLRPPSRHPTSILARGNIGPGLPLGARGEAAASSPAICPVPRDDGREPCARRTLPFACVRIWRADDCRQLAIAARARWPRARRRWSPQRVTRVTDAPRSPTLARKRSALRSLGVGMRECSGAALNARSTTPLNSLQRQPIQNLNLTESPASPPRRPRSAGSSRETLSIVSCSVWWRSSRRRARSPDRRRSAVLDVG